ASVVVPGLEDEAHAALARALDAIDAAPIVAIERMAVLAQGVERPDHVVGRDWAAVMEVRVATQVEDDPRPVLRHFHRLANQAITGEGLVLRADRERGVGERDAP